MKGGNKNKPQIQVERMSPNEDENKTFCPWTQNE